MNNSYKFSLIICTYSRSNALIKLLRSVAEQVLYPSEILIIDGSMDDKTQEALEIEKFKSLVYYKVKEKDRGLTKQRNYGVSKVRDGIEIICFLDDDVVLTPEYFQELIETYVKYPEAIGAGGYILNEVAWKKKESKKVGIDEYEWDGWVRKLGTRNELRKRLGLISNEPPGYMPKFSNGLSVGFLPPDEKIYPVEFFMGGVASYKKEIFEKIQFSTFFEDYGLYEDLDFCLRSSKIGQLYLNTSAKLYHHHDSSGRPNRFRYGKMVLRNGWYVWRVKYPSPDIVARLKWNIIALLLTLVRLGNTFTTSNRRDAFYESVGRIVGWWSLIFNKPKVM